VSNTVKVVIDTPGVSVTIETADQPTAEVAGLALQLYRDAGGWPQERRISAGFTHLDQPSEMP
jgi:hypothetical protein